MAKVTKPTALIFDFDGTLVDSLRVSLDILYQLAHHRQLPVDDMTVLRGMTLAQILRHLHVSPFRALLWRRRAYHAMAERLGEVALVPGVREMLQVLTREFPVYIVSSNDTENVRTALRHFGLDNAVRDVVGKANVLNKAGALRRLARHHRLALETTWYVGDQTGDVRAAHRVGMQAVAVSWGFSTIGVLEKTHPNLLVFTPEELTNHFVQVSND